MTNTIVTTHVNVTGAPVTNTAANHAEKPKKFNGQNFKWWQQKMFFYLTTMNLARFLKETASQVEPPKEGRPSNAQAVQAVKAWKHSGFYSNSKGKGKDKRKNDKKSKRKADYLAPKAEIIKQKLQGTCYNCDQPGHHASSCKMPKPMTPRSSNSGWWVDTGATRHVCANKCMFHSFRAVDNGEKLYMGNFATADIKGEGDVILKMTSKKELKLTNVLYVLEIRKNLLSGWLLNKFGFHLVFEFDKFVLSKDQMYVSKGYALNGMFKLNVMVVMNNINKMNSSAYLIESSNVWYGRLGHENGSSSRIYDEVVQDKRQRDNNYLHDEIQDQLEKKEVEPRRSKRARTEESFGPDFVSFMDTSSRYVNLCLYVDDMLIIGGNDKMIKSNKDMLKSKFDMKDMGLADVILRIKIIRTQNGLVLSQERYVDIILNTHNTGDSGLARTPIDPGLHLSNNRGAKIIALDKCEEEAEWLRQFVEDIPRLPKPDQASVHDHKEHDYEDLPRTRIYNRPITHLSCQPLHAHVVQELNELQGILTYIDSRIEIMDQFLNGFTQTTNEIDTDDLEPDDESIDTPLVSPFLDSGEDSDDGEVLNELEKCGNARQLCHERAINSFNGDDLAFQCMIGLRKFVAYFDPSLPMKIITRKAYNTIMVEGLESTEKNLVSIVRDVYVFVESFTYIIDYVILEDIGEFILRDMAKVVTGKPFKKVTKLEYECAKGSMSFTRIFDSYTF
nr:Pol polyprotein [Tanacetum cinerariifolium]